MSPRYDGSVVSIFLEQLINRCDNDSTVVCTKNAERTVPGGPCGFAGYRDWRLPNIKELHSMVDFSVAFPAPAVAAALRGASCGALCMDLATPACSCTQPEYAWSVTFFSGYTNAGYKTGDSYARAVRSGS